MSIRKEEDYYIEILDFFKQQLISNLKALGKEYIVIGKIGELSRGLRELINAGEIQCQSLIDYAKSIPPLNLDIFFIIINGEKFEILVLEIKKVHAVGLNELSQLIGYSIISNAKMGILINIDATGSRRMFDIMVNEPDISHIIRKYKKDWTEHFIGLMKWNSLTMKIEYTGVGNISTIPVLCQKISQFLD
jgi:hypothetical protein